MHTIEKHSVLLSLVVSVSSGLVFFTWTQACKGDVGVVQRKRMIYECYVGNFEKVVELSRTVQNLDFRAGPLQGTPDSWTIANGDLWTPLTAAIRGRHWVVAGYLIGRGASVDFTTRDGYSPIWLVAYLADGEREAIALAELLLKCGSDVGIYPTAPHDGLYADTPLHRAVAECEVEITRLLLTYGADLDKRGDNRESVRTWGVEYYRILQQIRDKMPYDRSPNEWDRIEEMSKLLQTTAPSHVSKEKE